MATKNPLPDRRDAILAAAVATLREVGYAGFTQPRVAKRAEVRQSHLTYYFPTRLALLEAVARIAVENQLALLDESLDVSSVQTAIKAITSVVVRPENTRVLLALAQAADEEPFLSQAFRDLADGVALRIGRLFEKLDIEATREHINLIHAVSVGLAVINLATQRPHPKTRVEALLARAFTPATHAPPRAAPEI
jgi:AcrR family transcriptional regulator